jgi:hypothetical protein
VQDHDFFFAGCVTELRLMPRGNRRWPSMSASEGRAGVRAAIGRQGKRFEHPKHLLEMVAIAPQEPV